MMGVVEREKGGVSTKTTENGMYLLSNDIPTKDRSKNEPHPTLNY
jgi:hypothetical protein